MKHNNMHIDTETVAEIGLLTAANLKLGLTSIGYSDPLFTYILKVRQAKDSFMQLISVACDEVVKAINQGRKLTTVIFAGYEGLFMDQLMSIIDKDRKVIVIPNSPLVNTERVAMNYNMFNHLSVADMFSAWGMMGHETIVFVPFFQLADGSAWVYKYSAPIINEHLKTKARYVIGIKLLDGIEIEPGYDKYGALQLLSEIKANPFQKIISVNSQNKTHELDNYSRSA